MEKMKDFFKYVDYLGKKETLKINSKTRYQSVFGGIISLITILLSVSMTIYLSLEIYFKKEPLIIYSRKILDELDNYSISKNGIYFFIALEFPNSTYYSDDSIFSLSGSQQHVIFDGQKISYKENEFEFKKCDQILTVEELKSFNLDIPLNHFYCPPEGLIIGGLWGNKFYNSIKININKCSNSSSISKISKNKCKPINEINKYINKGIVNIFLTDYIIDHQNVDNPIKKYYKDTFDRMSDKNAISYSISYQKLLFLDDLGLVFDNSNEMEIAKLYEVKTTYNFGEDNLIAFFQIFTINVNDICKRSYLKLQNLMTNIGGFIKSIKILGYLLYYIYYQAFKNIDQVLNSHRSSVIYYLNNKEIKNLNNNTENSKVKLNFNMSPQSFERGKNDKVNPKYESLFTIVKNKKESFMNFKDNTFNEEKEITIKNNFDLINNSKNLHKSRNVENIFNESLEKKLFKEKLNDKSNKISDIKKSDSDKELSIIYKALSSNPRKNYNNEVVMQNNFLKDKNDHDLEEKKITYILNIKQPVSNHGYTLGIIF